MALQRHAYSTSAPIDLVAVDGKSDRARILRKDLSPASLLATARTTKPAFLHDPRREIAVYRDVLPPRLGSPDFHGAVEDPERARFWLFLERVDGVELWQVGELDVWAEVARWAAALHAARLHVDAPPLAHRLLVRYDADHYRRWAARARAFGSGAGLAHVLRRHDALVERLLAMPQTFIHGELYPSNVLVGRTSDPVRVAVVDWETAGIGPALVDLAALVEGWDDDDRRLLLDAYRAAVAAHDPGGLAAVTADALDACRLHLCIRWLGWARTWTPPEEHQRDWLTLALGLTERLGL